MPRNRALIEITIGANIQIKSVENVKFMIDTRSTRSLINKIKAETFYKENIESEKIQVVSTHSISKHDQIFEINFYKIFKINKIHKFYIYEIGGLYEGLIGIDL
ncbi:hypothetical protein JYU34_015072 [Plutella xylostella]|uniref:Uncharacterized protein n=1 Tax=Plutella xylostella TaxID=51655 RepID=A0ABQ7Q687_PLUXY|nr:hypothetical protein JYU34_015072 [Plutella xylostella]